MSLITVILLAALVFLMGNVRDSEASCCCHCCKCCSCCTPCCNPPLLIKLPRTCPCCCKCCCPCCCCCGGGGGGRKRRDVRLLWKRAVPVVPFPQVQLPGTLGCQKCAAASACSNNCERQQQQCANVTATKREVVNNKLPEFVAAAQSSLSKLD